MEIMSALSIVLVPFLPLVLIAPVAFTASKNTLYICARYILWGFAGLTLSSLIGTALSVDVGVVILVLLIATSIALFIRRKIVLRMEFIWTYLGLLTLVGILTLVFAVPLFRIQHGLPTGDVQKSLIWSDRILSTHSLPDYGSSVEEFNRDPGDFYTPGLHTLTAAISRFSANSPISIALFSIVAAACVAVIGAAVAAEVVPARYKYIVLPVTVLFILSNTRFLRYLREPGYHYQNIFGELFVFGLLLLGLRLVRKFSWHDLALSLFCLAALIVSHQFSVFVGAFALLPVAIAFFGKKFIQLSHHVRGIIPAALGAAAVLILVLLAGIPFGLYAKIPHLFTTTPHLLSDVPNIVDYPLLVGPTWFLLGVAGFITFLIYAIREKNSERISFAVSVVCIFALSQGPRLFIDIPPVRALYYSVVPMSILAGFAISKFVEAISSVDTRFLRVALSVLIVGVVLVPSYQTTTKAFAATSHTVRTNSTLLPEYEYAISKLTALPGTQVLIDDYNRRSASWLILSGKPMFTRITADIKRQMNEAGQSGVRHDLYLRQLAYEKIFSLGSLPEAAHAMQQQGITHVTGVLRSSDGAFASNPVLTETLRAGDIVLYGINPAFSFAPSDISSWLLTNTTLVNDIGDAEDVYAHLPASIRSPRISDPFVQSGMSLRSSTNPRIPLAFNVGSYVRALWDQDDSGAFDLDAELYIKTNSATETLSVRLPDGATQIIETNTRVRIPAQHLRMNEKGIVEIAIENPTEKAITFDVIALGLAQVP